MKNHFKHGGNIKEYADLFNLQEDCIIDFSANINPLGLPVYIESIIRDNIQNILHYPDPQYKELKTSICNYLNFNTIDDEAPGNGNIAAPGEKNIIVGNGSSELLYLIAYALKPKTALILSPTFSEYERALLNAGSKIEYVMLNEGNEFDVSITEIIERVNDVDIVFLCNPNNPTGRITGREDLIYLSGELRDRGIFLVLDEAFIEMIDEHSLVDLAPENNYLIVLRSLTKFFGIPGLRLGFGVGSEKIIKLAESLKTPWTVNVFAEKLGARLIQDSDFIRKSKEFLVNEKDFLFEKLSVIRGINPYYSCTNFILIKITAPISSKQLQERMVKNGILIRDCGNFHGLNDSFIRVAVRNREQNLKLIKLLSANLSEL